MRGSKTPCVSETMAIRSKRAVAGLDPLIGAKCARSRRRPPAESAPPACLVAVHCFERRHVSTASVTQHRTSPPSIAIVEHAASEIPRAEPAGRVVAHDTRTPAGREQALDLAGLDLYYAYARAAAPLGLGLGLVGLLCLSGALPPLVLIASALLIGGACIDQYVVSRIAASAKRTYPRVWAEEAVLAAGWALLIGSAVSQSNAQTATNHALMLALCVAVLGAAARAVIGKPVAAHILILGVPAVWCAGAATGWLSASLLAFALLVCTAAALAHGRLTRHRLRTALELDECESLCASLASERGALIEREEAIFEGSSDGLLVADNQGKVIRINHAALALCGWSGAQAIGNTLTEVVNILANTPTKRNDRPSRMR